MREKNRYTGLPQTFKTFHQNVDFCSANHTSNRELVPRTLHTQQSENLRPKQKTKTKKNKRKTGQTLAKRIQGWPTSMFKASTCVRETHTHSAGAPRACCSGRETPTPPSAGDAAGQLVSSSPAGHSGATGRCVPK